MSETESAPSGGSGSQPPPTPPRAASAPKRLYRHPKGPLGGVASGLAGYFDVDPVIVRLLFIVGLLTGIGLPAYLVCWVVVPKAPSWPPPGYQTRTSGGLSGEASTLTSGFIIVVLAATIGHGVDGLGDFLLPAALVGFGVYLLNQRRRDDATPALASELGRDPHDVHDVHEGGFDGVGNPAAAAERGGPAQRSREPVVEPPGLVTPTVLSLLALLTGVGLALAAAGLMQLSVALWAAGGLLLVGFGLLASLWLGKAPWLIPLGLTLMATLLVSSSMDAWWARHTEHSGQNAWSGLPAGPDEWVREKTHRPGTLQDLESEYRQNVGELIVDLSQLDFTGTTRDVNVVLGVGEVTVIVPEHTLVEVQGNVGIGHASALGEVADGLGNSIDVAEGADAAGTLRINLSLGIGEGTVRRVR